MSDCQPMPGDDWGQTMVDLGYTWCRPCQECHRPPECAIREDGSTAHWWERSILGAAEASTTAEGDEKPDTPVIEAGS